MPNIRWCSLILYTDKYHLSRSIAIEDSIEDIENVIDEMDRNPGTTEEDIPFLKKSYPSV